MNRIILSTSFYLLNIFLFSSLISAAQNRGDLQVKLRELDFKTGTLIILLAQNDKQFNEEETGSLKSLINIGGVEEYQFTFKNLPFDSYAIKVFLDENDNQILDTNLVGTPLEKYGYSNNPKTIISNPRFANCRFGLVRDQLFLSITMR